MRRYELTISNYNLLKSLNLSELGESVNFNDETKTIETSDLRSVLLVIDDEITYAGLTEDQEECNDYGRKLYGLYDELYYQQV